MTQSSADFSAPQDPQTSQETGVTSPTGHPVFPIKPEFPQAVQDRLTNGQAAVQSNTQAAQAAFKRHLNKVSFGLDNLMKLAKSGSKHRVKGMGLLRELAMVWAHDIGAHSACHKGCTSCCSLPVPISAVEAKVIGKAIKRRVAPVHAVQDNPEDVPRIAPSPCPFLVNSTCAIYENRPMLCRTRLNMDVDALLCDAQINDSEVPVPMPDASAFYDAYRRLSADGGYADLRDFFPHGLAAAKAE